MMEEVYKDMDNRAKLIGNMGYRERNDAVWDLAEELKVIVLSRIK